MLLPSRSCYQTPTASAGIDTQSCQEYSGFLLSWLPKRVPETKLLGGEEDGEREIQTEKRQGKACLVSLLGGSVRQ